MQHPCVLNDVCSRDRQPSTIGIIVDRCVHVLFDTRAPICTQDSLHRPHGPYEASASHLSVNQWDVLVGLSETSQSASETKSTFIGLVVRRGGRTGNHILNCDEKPRTCALLIAY